MVFRNSIEAEIISNAASILKICLVYVVAVS